MYHREGPEHAGGGGEGWLLAMLAAGLAVLVLLALGLLVGPVVADDPLALEPTRILATWAAR